MSFFGVLKLYQFFTYEDLHANITLVIHTFSTESIIFLQRVEIRGYI